MWKRLSVVFAAALITMASVAATSVAQDDKPFIERVFGGSILATVFDQGETQAYLAGIGGVVVKETSFGTRLGAGWTWYGWNSKEGNGPGIMLSQELYGQKSKHPWRIALKIARPSNIKTTQVVGPEDEIILVEETGTVVGLAFTKELSRSIALIVGGEAFQSEPGALDQFGVGVGLILDGGIFTEK